MFLLEADSFFFLTNRHFVNSSLSFQSFEDNHTNVLEVSSSLWVLIWVISDIPLCSTFFGLIPNYSTGFFFVCNFRAKGRPSDNPLIVHVADISQIKNFVKCIPETAKCLAENFWPGPLSIIFDHKSGICERVRAGLGTVAGDSIFFVILGVVVIGKFLFHVKFLKLLVARIFV